MHFNPPFSLSPHDLSTFPPNPLLSPLTNPFSISPSPEPFSDHPPQPRPVYRSTSSAVPFSWEHQPGIPKLHPPSHSSKPHLLPLPPLRSTVNFPRNKRSSSADFDPFAVALARCAEDSFGENIDGMWWRRSVAKSVGVWRRAAVAGGFGLVSFYGSCKTACCVSDAIVALPRRARRGGGSYGRVNRRRE